MIRSGVMARDDSPPRPVSVAAGDQVLGASLRPTLQRRSRETLERIIETGSEVLAELGWEGFTVAEVSRRANVAIGSIYQRVEDKDALFYAIVDRVNRQIDEEVEIFADGPRWQDLSAAELVAECVVEMSEVWRRHAAHLRVFVLRAPSSPQAARRGSKGLHDYSAKVEALLLTRRSEFVHPDPERAVDAAFRLCYSALMNRVAWGPLFETERALTWDEFVGELVTACQKYLLSASVA